MLRITVHENGALCRLELAGRLEGPWVAEIEHAWRSLSWSGKELEVDMKDVTGVDDAGRELLAAMHQAGARLVARGVWMRALIEEITSNQPFDVNERQPQTKNFPTDQHSRIRRHTR
jgi:hypothetical protein